MTVYQRCLIRLRQRDRWGIWYTDEEDGLVLRGGKVPFFGSEAEVLALASGLQLCLDPDEPVLYQFDQMMQWVQRGDGDSVDCSEFISVFNLCTDVAVSLGQAAHWELPEFDRIYEKLFYGCNLPSITPEGECYVPRWSAEELVVLRTALRQALDQFLGGVELVPDP